ncbi:hypothetical protein [Glutamicibacter halophytocola]|uniref:hypothetical protein n=1 Tax=Glutamicibacter halophytocola TaxID=1933880 RepID=UPI003703B92F
MAYKLISKDNVTRISHLNNAIQLEIDIDGSIDEIITLALDFLYLIDKICLNEDGSLHVIENP